MSRRRTMLAGGVVMLAVGLTLAGNAQYLVVSTYRIKNDSGPSVARVRLVLESGRGVRELALYEVGRDRSRTGWLMFRGEASLRASVEPATRPDHWCSTYVEGRGDHVDIDVDAAGGIHCWVKVVGATELGLLNVVP